MIRTIKNGGSISSSNSNSGKNNNETGITCATYSNDNEKENVS